ncbi:YqzL-like protein, partial [Dysosmobacter welbionis]
GIFHGVPPGRCRPGYCGGTFSRNRPGQAVLCRDGGLF